MTDSRKILLMIVAVFAAMSLSVSVNAQLPMKKPGTIKEQIKNSTLFNDEQLDPLIADLLDYSILDFT